MAKTVATVLEFLTQFAPLEQAEAWDNVGLIVGDTENEVTRVMTCLTITPDVVAEAISDEANLIVSHHPLLFRPVQRLTTKTTEGKILLSLIQNGVAVYSPHTAFDSARLGINQQLADSFGLRNIAPLRPATVASTESAPGSGRYGDLPSPMLLGDFVNHVKQVLNIPHVQYIGHEGHEVSRIGVACGSAAEFLTDALAHGCHALVTGEARFHACLEARNLGAALILAGHYATERPAVEHLAGILQREFEELTIWASRVESDPVNWSVE